MKKLLSLFDIKELIAMTGIITSMAIMTVGACHRNTKATPSPTETTENVSLSVSAKERTDSSYSDIFCRYGTVTLSEDGKETEIETLDGNVWLLVDIPEYPVGTHVRLLCDGNHTLDADDDVVLDIIEFDWTQR